MQTTMNNTQVCISHFLFFNTDHLLHVCEPEILHTGHGLTEQGFNSNRKCNKIPLLIELWRNKKIKMFFRTLFGNLTVSKEKITQAQTLF